MGGEKGSADTERDPRGFAIKFYTEEGNWDLVGNNTPMFFIRDPIKFPDFVHTQKRNPRDNMKSAAMMWDFWSLNPESLHQVTMLFSDRVPDASFQRCFDTWCSAANVPRFLGVRGRTLGCKIRIQRCWIGRCI